MKKIRIGLIGAGFIGRAHATAYHNIIPIFGPEVEPELVAVADPNETNAKAICLSHKFQRYSTSWEDVVNAADVDAVVIATPNNSHCEISIAAAQKGKHVMCEKPLGMDGIQADEAVKVIQSNGVVGAVGFNMVKVPVIAYAKELIISGKLGKLVSFRGTYDTDGLSDENANHEWRMLKKNSTLGAMGDLGAHTLSISQYLLGNIKRVCGSFNTVYKKRPDPHNNGKILPVENEDIGQVIFDYEQGGLGVLVSSRVACGRKQSCTVEIQFTQGTLFWTLERMNEMWLFKHEGDHREEGFRLLQVAPGHGEYARFFSGPGIGLGYEDLKVIEAYHFLKNIAEGTSPDVDFKFGATINHVLDAIVESDKTDSWTTVKIN